MKRRQKEALAAASGACTGTCEAAQELRSKLARTEDALAKADALTWRLSVEVHALREQIELERSLRRGLVP